MPQTPQAFAELAEMSLPDAAERDAHVTFRRYSYPDALSH
jgi:hypothetical protein